VDYCQGHEESQEQRLKEGLNKTFKQGTRQDYVIQKQKHKNQEQEHEMCKTNMKSIFILLTYVNMKKT
jgi:hypothetical protein